MARSWIDTSDVRRRAWRGLIFVSNELLARMGEELSDVVGLTLPEYDALLHTADVGDDGIRMTDLADHVLLTKAGLTALVDRLEKRGLMDRRPDPGDRRVVRVVLTPQGWDTFRHAAAFHVTQIERYFTDSLTDDEAAVLVRVLERARTTLEQTAPLRA